MSGFLLSIPIKVVRMETPISVYSIAIDLLEHLGIKIKAYQKEKKVKERLFNALSNEIEGYVNNFEVITNIGTTRLLPLLELIRDVPTVSQMNNLVECIADFYFVYLNLVNSFIEIVNGCYEISSYEAFMKDLEESSALLHDFVISMRNMCIAHNRIKIGYSFYRFLKLYEDEILKEIKVGDVDKVVKEMENYIDILENKVKPSFSKSSISRKTRKKLIKNFKNLLKVSKNVKIQGNILKDLRAYVPSNLLPIVVLIEESKLMS